MMAPKLLHGTAVFVAFSVTFITTSLAQSSAFAQASSYPERPVRFYCPFPPGGSTDLISRLLGKKLSESFGQPVIVENRPGGAGIIAAEAVSKAPADGYLLLLGNTGIFAINPHLYSKLPYDPLKGFSPVSMLARVPNLLVVHPSVPAKSVGELVALAKKGRTKLNYGSAGSGSLQHLAMEMFKTAAAVDFVHVPYKGAGPALVDLIGGHLDLQVATLPSVVTHIKHGRLRPLAIGDATRSAAMPDLPTVAESGYPGYEAYSWHGLFVRAGTPTPIVSVLNQATVKALKMKDSTSTLEAQGFDVVASSIKFLVDVVQSDYKRYEPVVKAAGARVD